jgi:cytochrome b6-f complex iron-sulfur subunit
MTNPENSADTDILDLPKKSRRDFLSIAAFFGLFGWMSTSFYSLFSFLRSPDILFTDSDRISLGEIDSMKPGTGKSFKLGNTPGIIVRMNDGSLRAFSSVCSHMKCVVEYKEEEEIFLCPCHKGKYDLSGKVLNGPPPKPLAELKAEVIKNQILVYQIEEKKPGV